MNVVCIGTFQMLRDKSIKATMCLYKYAHACQHSYVYIYKYINGEVNKALLSSSVREILFWLEFYYGSIPESAEKFLNTEHLRGGIYVYRRIRTLPLQ